MTTANTTAGNPQRPGRFRLPDPPERQPDEKMTSAKHLHQPGNTHHLAQHFGNSETTLVAAELYVTMSPEELPSGSVRRYPDLLIAFGVDPAAYYASNGYIIMEQGKPPDFVLEIASRSTGDEDTGPKWRDYEALGITEYWRFDETGEHHKTRLAGDRLESGRYQPVSIEEIDNGILQGYSTALNLYLRWEQGRLAWHDPATGRHILTYDDQRDRADREHNRADRAEAHVRELEAELRRLRDR